MTLVAEDLWLVAGGLCWWLMLGVAYAGFAPPNII